MEDFLSHAPGGEPDRTLKAMGCHNHKVLPDRFLDDDLRRITTGHLTMCPVMPASRGAELGCNVLHKFFSPAHRILMQIVMKPIMMGQ